MIMDTQTTKELISKLALLVRNPETHKIYASTILEFISTAQEISRAEVEKFLAQKAEKYSKESVRRMLAALKRFFDLMILENMLDKNPARNVSIRKTENEIEDFLTYEQIERLMKFYKGENTISIRNRAILELMYATAALPEDICSLTLEQTRLVRSGWIRMRFRGKKERPLPLGKYARAWLMAWLKVRPQEINHPFVFVNYTGGPISRVTIWEIVKRAGAGSGLGDKISPRTVRNSFIMHMRECDKRVLQYILGNQKIEPIKRRASL